MSTPLFSITEGWTQELGPFTLRLAEVPVTLTGFTVEPVLHDSLGNLIATGGVTRIATDQIAEKGHVYYTPVAADFVWNTEEGTAVMPQEFRLHWKVTDGLGKVVFFPNGVADVVAVHRK